MCAKYISVIIMTIVLSTVIIEAEESLPEVKHSSESINQRDGTNKLELQCLPLFSKTGNVEGVYVFFINYSGNELHFRGSRHVPQGLDITVSIPDIKELNEYGFSFNPVKTLYHPVIWLNSKVLQGPQTFAMSIAPGEIIGKRIVFDNDAKEALRKAKAWQVYVFVARLFYVFNTNGEQKLEPVRMSLRRVFYNQKDAKALLANTCYQKPFMLGEPDDDNGETGAAGGDAKAKEQGETPSKPQ